MKKEVEKDIEAMERYFNELPALMDPCKICKHKEEDTGHDITICPKCCYYHPSLFEISKRA